MLQLYNNISTGITYLGIDFGGCASDYLTMLIYVMLCINLVFYYIYYS